jgi:hypothetical protein
MRIVLSGLAVWAVGWLASMLLTYLSDSDQMMALMNVIWFTTFVVCLVLMVVGGILWARQSGRR